MSLLPYQQRALAPINPGQNSQKNVQDIQAARISHELKQKAGFCLKTARSLRKQIPKLEGMNENQKQYYEGLIKQSQHLEDSVIKSEAKFDEAENNLVSISKDVKSLFNKLDDFKSRSYQQTYNVQQYSVELKKIEVSKESLEKIKAEITKEEEELTIARKANAQVVQHLGPEYSAEDFQKYLKPSEIESQSLQRFQDLSLMLRDKSHELNDKVRKKEESNKKAKELEDRINKLNSLAHDTRNTLIEEKKGLEVFAERREQLRNGTNDAYSSSIQKIHENKEAQQERMKQFFENRMNQIDGMIEKLLKQLASCSTINPFLHYIFVLDESGSMAGARWESLIKALNEFVEKNKAQNSDLLSVITFDSQAHEHLKKVKFSEYQPPKPRWGGTNFDKALEMARDFTNLSRTHCPVVIFLTDGECGMRQTPSLLREMSSTHRDRGFMFFSIGVGDYQIETLKEITRLGNNGNCYIDLGDDRIEFLHTTKDEKVLSKIFTEISNAIRSRSIKIKAAIETLKEEKGKVREEAEMEGNFYNKMSEEERKDIDRNQEDVLNRRIKSLNDREAEDKQKIEFYTKEEQNLYKEVEELQSVLEKERRTVTDTEIAALTEEENALKTARADAWKEKEQFSNERKVILAEIMKNKDEMHVSTSPQLLDLYRAKDDVEELIIERKMYLTKFKNYLNSVSQDVSYIQEELKNADVVLNELEEDGALDIVLECFKGSVEINKNEDIPNMRRIGIKILGIKEGDTNKQVVLDLVFDSLHPRKLVSPTATLEDHRSIIKAMVDQVSETEIETIDENCKQLRKDLEKKTKDLKQVVRDIRTFKDELEELEEKDIPKKEKKIRNLKSKLRKLNKVDDANKENHHANNSTRIDNDDEKSDGEDEDSLRDELNEDEKSFKAMKMKLESDKEKELKKSKNYLEEKIEEMETEISHTERKKTEKEREVKKLLDNVLKYYTLLRNELMPKIKKYAHDARNSQLEVFQENLSNTLSSRIKSYFEAKNDPVIMERINKNDLILSIN